MGTATGPAAPQEVKIHTGCGPAALQKSQTTDCVGGCQVVLWAADCHSLALGSSREAPSCAFHGSWSKDTGFMTSRAMVTWKPGCWSGRNWPSSARFSPSGVNHCLPFSFYLGQIMRCVFTGQHASGLCDFQLKSFKGEIQSSPQCQSVCFPVPSIA